MEVLVWMVVLGVGAYLAYKYVAPFKALVDKFWPKTGA